MLTRTEQEAYEKSRIKFHPCYIIWMKQLFFSDRDEYRIILFELLCNQWINWEWMQLFKKTIIWRWNSTAAEDVARFHLPPPSTMVQSICPSRPKLFLSILTTSNQVLLGLHLGLLAWLQIRGINTKYMLVQYFAGQLYFSTRSLTTELKLWNFWCQPLMFKCIIQMEIQFCAKWIQF